MLKNSKVVIAILLLLLLLFCVGVGRSGLNKQSSSQLDKEASHPIEDEQQTKVAESEIMIPGYSSRVITKDNPTIQLINPEGNTVYLVYTIKEGDTELHKTKAIKPGNSVNFNAKEHLSKGTHTLSFEISTYDINSEEACNGAKQSITYVVEE